MARTAQRPALDAPVAVRDGKPKSWRKRTGAGPVGRPPRIFEVVTLRRKGVDVQVPLVDAICERLRIGVPISGAAESLGIHRASFHEWCAIGDADAKAGKVTVYSEFADKVRRARAESMVIHVGNVAAQGPTDWRASFALLQTQHSREFAFRHRLEVGPIEDDMPEEAANRAIREAAHLLEADAAIDVEGVPGPALPGVANVPPKRRNGKGGNGNGAR